MRPLHRFIYITVSFLSYVTLAVLAFFFLDDILDIISRNSTFHTLVFILWLLVLDPIITYLILDKVPIRPALRLKGNIREDMKREV